MKTDAFKKFLKHFEKSGYERLDGLDASFFKKMTNDEKSEAFEILKHRLHNGSDEAVKGLMLVSKRQAKSELLDRYSYLKNKHMLNRQLMTLAYYLYLYDAESKYQKDIAYFLSDDDRIVKLKALNYLGQTNKNKDVLSVLERVLISEDDKTVSFVAARQLLEEYGIIENDPITGDVFNNNVNRFFEKDLAIRRAALKWLKESYAPKTH